MLLAMVVAIMSAVVVFLQPFVIDLNDNRAWAAGGVTAEQMNSRILVVAGMPNGTGLVHQTGIPGGSIDVLFNIESWTDRSKQLDDMHRTMHMVSWPT